MLESLIRSYPEPFYEELRQGARAHVRIGIVLGAIGVGGFAIVDPSLMDDASLAIALGVRAAGIALLFSVLALTLIPGWASKHARIVSLFACLLTGGVTVFVTYLTGGASSRYHEALFPIIFGYAMLSLPWRRWDAAIVFGAVLLFYDLLLFVGGASGSTALWATNNALLWLTWLVAVTLQSLLQRGRFNEFVHRTELAEANVRLLALDRAKSRFFANLSHELRTPLTLILAPVEALIEEASASPTSGPPEKLNLVRRNALRLLRLVDDLLALTRAEAASLRLRVGRVDMVALARILESEVTALAERKQITFGVLIEPNVPEIQGDLHLIERVLLNLLGNAAKFTERGGRIGLSLAPHPDGGVLVAVNDTGIGIPADALPRIFDRFFQVDGDGAVGGTGIGLALAREIVSLHGGEISVDSVEGVGTTFRFRLPPRPPQSASVEGDVSAGFDSDHVDPAKGLPEWHGALRERRAYRLREIDDATERRVAPRPNPRSLGRAPTVLIVEDNVDMIRFLVAILAGEFNTLTARDGAMGLRMAIERRPDLVLSDVMMPEMDGFEMVRRLRLDPHASQIPIILLTARGAERDRVEGRAGGADVFLAKPFKVEELLAAIRSLLDRQQSVRQAAHYDSDELLVFMATGLVETLARPLSRLSPLTHPGGGHSPSRLELAEAVVELRAVADELREFAEAGVGEALTETSVADAVRSAISSVDMPRDGADIVFRATTAARVQFPAGQLTRVVAELLRNALAATPSGGNVYITASDERNGTVQIRVQDEGPGVPPQHAERIFYPYYETGDAGGRLTMAICRRLVEQHGGAIFVDATAGDGATVVIELPALAPAEPEGAQETAK